MRCENWNRGWSFWEEKDAFALVWNVPAQAEQVELPHDAMAAISPRADSPNGGDTGYRDGGNYVYVKTLHAPEEWRQRTVALQFDGVYMNALVYVNGQLAGQRPNGYVPFVIPLNDHLRYGEDNEVRVLVKNGAMPNSRWYSGSGIYRDVWLLTADTAYFPHQGAEAVTLWLEEGAAGLELRVTVENRACWPRELRVEGELTAPDGAVAARVSLPAVVAGGAREELRERVTVEQPLLWDHESPQLYRCLLRLTEEGRELDREELTVGIRQVWADARRGFRVNGRPVKLRGACIHHDNGLLGAVSTPEAELRRVRLLKQAGFNALRMAHNPASPHLLDACDRLGMYVMDETFDMWTRPKKDCDYALWFGQWWREDITAVVNRDRRHPSVVMYSLGNEIPEIGLPGGAALCRQMAELCRRLDPTRLTLVSVNGVFAAGDCVGRIVADVTAEAGAGGEGGNVNDFMSVMDAHMDRIVCHPLVSRRLEAAGVGVDVLGYNYMAARYEADGTDYPNRVVVGSETYPPDIPRNWALVERLPQVIGDFTWTGWDYIGEAGVGIPAYAFGEGGFGARFPCQLAYCGDLDITGVRRPLSYFREMVFGLRAEPYIAVQNPRRYGQPLRKTPWVLSDAIPSWTYPGLEGQPVVVEVYSPGDQVELLLDGVSLGRRPAGRQGGFLARFETQYRPGVLTAVAYEAGQELGRCQLSTVGEPVELRLRAEPRQAGDRLVYVDIALVDSQGRVVPHRDGELRVSVTGGALAGLGSGDPKPAHSYQQPIAGTHYGRALAILRPRAGEELSLTVEGGGLRGRLTVVEK